MHADTVSGTALDLEAYLARIDYTGRLASSRATLEALHLAHATHIPFENLDILLGRGIRLDLASLQQKLVAGRRGGYCFEQNLLFASVLETLGFEVMLLAARVRYGASTTRPRTHMCLLVHVEEQPLIADVGFGGDGLLLPVPLGGAESPQFAWTYRIVADGRLWVMQSKRGDDWRDLYAFTLEPHERVDYEVYSHYTSTFPSSPFRAQVVAQRPFPDRRLILRGREFSIETASGLASRTIADDALLDVLREEFGLVFPIGTMFTMPR